jgi:hypothetical protein
MQHFGVRGGGIETGAAQGGNAPATLADVVEYTVCFLPSRANLLENK